MKTVAYEPDFGTFEYPEGFEALIEGLPIDEQLNFFRMANRLYIDESLNERKASKWFYNEHLEIDPTVEAVIVHDGKICGVMVKTWRGGEDAASCMVEHSFCYHRSWETDGSGEKEFSSYRAFACVPADFDLAPESE